MKAHAIVTSLVAAAAIGGCASNRPLTGQTVATWQMPWQLNPADAASAEKGEEYTSAYVPGAGIIRGTRSALSGIGRPLAAAPGRNRTVETCRSTVAGEAAKLGAREVEAASLGPERRERSGNYTAPVMIRVTYPRILGYEIRQAAMTCTVSATGSIVDAKALEDDRAQFARSQ